MAKHSNNVILRDEVALKESAPSIRLRQARKVSGRGVIADELADDAEARAAFRVRMLYLRKIPRSEWTTKQFKSLKHGLWEIKWSSGKKKVEWRALGFYDADGFYVVVKICTHKMNIYTPKECIDTARSMKANIESDKQKVIEYGI